MRIAFIINNYPPRVGGVELHVQALATELACLGHEPLVITLGSDPGWHSDGKVPVLTLPEHLRIGDVLGFPSFGTRRKLTQLLKSHNIEVVSTHTRFFPTSFVGLRAALSAGLPVVHTEHGSGFVANGSAFIRAASRLVDLTLGRWVMGHATKVLGVSESVVDFVRTLSGVNAEVFYNAIVAEDAADAPTSPADRPNHLVFVGRVVEGKGWDVYLDILASLRAEGRDFTGEVLGDGIQLSALRRQVAELNFEDIVSVRGRVSQQDVRTALRGATLINPTVLSEGFQTSLLETIAERGRVVTYPVPGAEKLRSQGAPVLITADRSPASLKAAVVSSLDSPAPPADSSLINGWTWPARAQQYIEICQRVMS